MKFFILVSKIKSFLSGTSGATSIEYSLIALLISTAIVAGASAIGSSDIVTLKSVNDVWPS